MTSVGLDNGTRRRIPIGAVVLILAAVVTFAGVFPFRQMLAQNRQLEQTRDRYETLSNENARLEEEIAQLQTDAEIERIAREQLGLVKPGEVEYRVIAPEGPAPDPVAEEPVLDDRNVLQKVWDFLTGRDLVPSS